MTTFDQKPDNPFNLSNVGDASKPTADLDEDGDLDAFTGEEYGNTKFFQKIGSPSGPNFVAPQRNPFGLSRVGYGSTPTLADIDSDGDLDVFIGNSDGSTKFFQNTGNPSSPKFATAVTNPFGLSNVRSISAPTLVDIDGDTDGNTKFFQNTSSSLGDPPPLSSIHLIAAE